jgi:hypothetical protein
MASGYYGLSWLFFDAEFLPANAHQELAPISQDWPTHRLSLPNPHPVKNADTTHLGRFLDHIKSRFAHLADLNYIA